MEETKIPSYEGRIPNYYEGLGRAHDYLMRCKDCQGLVTFAAITKLGCCDRVRNGNACGNKKFTEITILSEQEMADIASGAIDFPDRDKFMAEFHGVA